MLRAVRSRPERCSSWASRSRGAPRAATVTTGGGKARSPSTEPSASARAGHAAEVGGVARRTEVHDHLSRRAVEQARVVCEFGVRAAPLALGAAQRDPKRAARCEAAFVALVRLGRRGLAGFARRPARGRRRRPARARKRRRGDGRARRRAGGRRRRGRPRARGRGRRRRRRRRRGATGAGRERDEPGCRRREQREHARGLRPGDGTWRRGRAMRRSIVFHGAVSLGTCGAFESMPCPSATHADNPTEVAKRPGRRGSLLVATADEPDEPARCLTLDEPSKRTKRVVGDSPRTRARVARPGGEARAPMCALLDRRATRSWPPPEGYGEPKAHASALTRPSSPGCR